MVCEHLSELYQLCEKNHLRLAGPDLIRIVCKQCNQEETCPSVLTDEYDSDFHKGHGQPDPSDAADSDKSSGK